MIDTSALIAALLTQHRHHAVAAPHLPHEGPIPATVLAESYSQLRRTFDLSARDAAAVLSHWLRHRQRIAALPSEGYVTVFEHAVELDLGGNVHDAIIAMTCAHHSLPLATLDRRQHALALAFGVDSTYLLDDSRHSQR